MLFKIKQSNHSWVIIGSCLAVLAIILTAGLWPFHSPKNDVSWLTNEDGIRFGRFGCVFSTGPIGDQRSKENASGSLELWIKPAPPTRGRRTILAFEGPGDDSTAFSLQQNGNSLIIQRKNIDRNGVFHTAEFTLKEALTGDSRMALTVTLGTRDTNVYRNGVLAGSSRLVGQSIPVFAGRAVLGNFLNVGGAWLGQFYGLAIYDRKLTSEEVALHAEGWDNSRRPKMKQDEQPVALYLFTEHAGRVVHEQIASQANLIVPERYTVLRPEFLALPWRHFRSTLGYWEDVVVNILGFVPFGLSFLAYFTSTRMTKHPVLLVIFLGFLTSLTIEVLQAYLPTRNSGMNDLFTNTFGTGLGVLLYRTPLAHRIFGK
jgi:VanZ like family/Concanavalin A-like lectin/glucanases superfamily